MTVKANKNTVSVELTQEQIKTIRKALMNMGLRCYSKDRIEEGEVYMEVWSYLVESIELPKR